MSANGWQAHWADLLDHLERTVEPDLPGDTRLKPIKDAMLRVGRLGRHAQVEFNRKLTDLLRRVADRVEEFGTRHDGELSLLNEGQRALTARLDALSTEVETGFAQTRERIQTEVSARTAEAARAQSELRDRLSKLEETARATESRLETVVKWVDSLRKELFYELRYKLEEIERADEPQILEPPKYEIKAAQMKDGLRVNFGSGVVGIRGSHEFINVDMRAVDGVDIRADVRKLPFAENSIGELNSFHLVEHFSDREMRTRILPYWFKLMRPGGLIRIVCPDAGAMMRKWSANEFSYDALREVMFGSQEYDGDQHFNMFTRESLTRLLEEVGFVDVRCISEERVNGQCFEMELEARKPQVQSNSTAA